MIRIVFIDESNKLEKGHESGYVKLHFLDTNGTQTKRTYTIRQVDNNLITIDFVNHGAGQAARWLANAHIGDCIEASGPGACKLANMHCDWFVFIGDLTALPAIYVNLKTLAKDAQGYAILEIRDESDKQVLDCPKSIEIRWILNTNSTSSAELINRELSHLPWLAGQPYLWVAGEFNSAITLRKWAKDKVFAHNRYISSYWKSGESDEGNKRAKKLDGGF